MPDHTSLPSTNLPVHSDRAELSSDQRQRQFFSNYYTRTASIDPVRYDIVRGHLTGRNIDPAAADNLAATLVEAAAEQNLSAEELIDLMNVSDPINMNTILCILLNISRNRTGIIGFNQTPDPVPADARLVLP